MPNDPVTLATRAFNTPLLLDPAKAAVIARALGPRFLQLGAGVPVDVEGFDGEISARHSERRPKAGSLLSDGVYRFQKDRGGAYPVIGGVAIITVTGTLVRRGSYVGESSGTTSYEGISAQVRAAAEDPQVRAIALEIDSFGGEAAGIFDLAQQLRAARELKPMRAFIADYALSAGYAIASQADHITVPPYGEAGSIGVVMMHADFEGHLEKEGVKVTLIHSGAHKVDGNPFQALPESVRDDLQKRGDRMWGGFAELVALGRRGKLTVKTALATEAAVFEGAEAVRQNLADEVSEARVAFEAFVEEMNSAAVTAAPAAMPGSAHGGQSVRVSVDATAPKFSREDIQAVLEGVQFEMSRPFGIPPRSIEFSSSHEAGVDEDGVDTIEVPVLQQVPAQEFAAALTQSLRDHGYPGASVALIESSPGCKTGAEAPQPKETDMPQEDVTKPGADKQTGTETQASGTTPTPSGSQQAQPSAADAMQAERERVSKISAKAAKAGVPASLTQKLIDDGTPLAEAYEQILDAKAERASDGGEIRNTAGGARVTGDARDRTREGMTAALLLKAGMEGGESNEFTSMSLREMARHSLGVQNIAIPVGGVMAMAGAAFAPAAASGGMHSTSDFATILADVANKAMLKGFMEAEETFERFTSTGTMSDFKAVKRVGLDAFPSLLEVAEGAEFKHGTLGDHGETAMLATYGRLFAITRQTIINDDLDAFTRVPGRMGRAARRTVGDLVFAVLSANAALSDGTALFHADHGNLASSGAGPSEATINAAITAMSTQKDRGGKANLNISPKFLLAPPSWRSATLQALNSEYAPDDTDKQGTAKQPRAYNTVRDAAEPIFDARIEGKEWYALGDPNMHDTIEVGYLDGISTPFMDQQDGWTVDGTEYKVRIDATATALGYQALYKNPGE